MQKFIGTKHVKAMPMTRGQYNELRKWEMPANENADDPGYLVEYSNGGPSNVPGFVGHISWSPEAVFEDSYVRTNYLTFSEAIDAVHFGEKAARHGWNGRGMFIFYVDGSQFIVNRPPLLGIFPEGTEIKYNGHVDMYHVDGSISPWFASQMDMNTDDWYLLDDE